MHASVCVSLVPMPCMYLRLLYSTPVCIMTLALTSSPPPPHPSQFSHLRLPSLHGDWLTVPNLSMVAPDSCCISSERCGESGPPNKFFQEVSPTLSTPLHMQGQQGMLDSVATTTSAGGEPSPPPFPSFPPYLSPLLCFMGVWVTWLCTRISNCPLSDHSDSSVDCLG